MNNCQNCGIETTAASRYYRKCFACGHMLVEQEAAQELGTIDFKALSAAAGRNARADGAFKDAPVMVTTEPGVGLDIVERLDVVSAECVVGLNILQDVLAAFRDVVGGRSTRLQSALRDARLLVLEDLRTEARRLGANAVVAVDLDYSEISGQGKSMLFVVATGTAVRLQPDSARSAAE